MSDNFSFVSAQLTIRLVQGYRFLDKCGEAMIQLESRLGENWLPGELAPTAGNIKNETIGIHIRFNAENITVSQTDFLDHAIFHSTACAAVETLLNQFGIQQINAPVLRLVAQSGRESIEQAQTDLVHMGLFLPSQRVIASLGAPTTIEGTMCVEEDVVWQNLPVHRRRRLNASCVRQYRHIGLDDRLARRTKLLPTKQQEAVKALAKLRREVRPIPEFAIQIDMENLFESELRVRSFDLSRFIADSTDELTEVLHGLLGKEM